MHQRDGLTCLCKLSKLAFYSGKYVRVDEYDSFEVYYTPNPNRTYVNLDANGLLNIISLRRLVSRSDQNMT